LSTFLFVVSQYLQFGVPCVAPRHDLANLSTLPFFIASVLQAVPVARRPGAKHKLLSPGCSPAALAHPI